MSHPSPDTSLQDLLLTLFNQGTLLQWLTNMYPVVVNNVRTDTPGNTAFDAVQVLKRHGLIIPVFFDALLQARPNQEMLIRPVAQVWGAPMPTRHNLPRATADFVGREAELAQIHAALGAKLVAPTQPVSLSGLGGMGKTMLALRYAELHLGDYETVGWVDAGGAEITANFAALAGVPLGLALPPTMPLPDKVQAVRAWLRQGGPHLLVFDNVEDTEGYVPLIEGLFSVRVLITTRRQDLDGVSLIPVARLPEPDALLLLLGPEAARTPPPGSIELCNDLEFLTLALAVASRILAKKVETPAALRERIQRAGVVPFFDEKHTPKALGREASLRKLFDASVALLDEADPIDAHARRLLWVGGWFAPAPIPQGALHDAAVRLGEVVEADTTTLALGRLVDLGLFPPAPAPQLNRLLAAYSRHRGGDPARTAVLDALGVVAAATPPDTLALLGLAPLAPHIAKAVEQISASSPEPHLLLALRLAQHYKHIARYAAALVVSARLIPVLGAQVWASYFLNEAGQILDRQGKYAEALTFYQSDLGIKETTLGPQHPDTAVTLHAIGQALHRQGKYAEALTFYQRSLDIKATTLGPKHPQTAITLNDIGQTLMLQGKYAEALDFYQSALGILETTLGLMHPETASTLYAIGQTLHDQGKYAEALDFYQRALHILETTLGPTHPSTAVTLNAVGQTLMLQGQYAEALTFYQRALDIKETTLGPKHPETASTLHTIGQTLHQQGKNAEALTFYQRALDIEETTQGPMHPNTAFSLFELGRCRRDGGDPQGLTQMQEAADRLERILGAEHPDVKAARSFL